MRAAVVVPVYRPLDTPGEIFSFENTLKILSEHDVFIACPPGMQSYLDSLRQSGSLDFEIILFPSTFFSSISDYNRLLLSIEFYTAFDKYEYLLVVQTDALVFSDQLHCWCDRGFSYIGAPWFRGMTRPSHPLKLFGVGNGGFSLRKVDDFLAVLSDSNVLKNGKVSLRWGEKLALTRTLKHCLVVSKKAPLLSLNVNEDLFWGMVAPRRYSHFVVPLPEEAGSFAFEAEPKFMFERNGRVLPFGCHAWERYDEPFWRNALRDHSFELPN